MAPLENPTVFQLCFQVILGEYDQLSAEAFPPDAYLAIDVVRHPEYQNLMRFRDNGFLESEPRYDVAMLMLDREVDLAPNVAPICLPNVQNIGTTLLLFI